MMIKFTDFLFSFSPCTSNSHSCNAWMTSWAVTPLAINSFCAVSFPSLYFMGRGASIVVVDDSHIQRIVVVVFFTLTDRASTIPSNIRGCQYGTWSPRGTKVNGSHHRDNPLLRPTRIQIATKSYATLQAMAPTNNKTVHQTSFTPYREQPRSTRIVVAYPRPAFSATNRTNAFQPVLINNSKFLKVTHIVQK